MRLRFTTILGFVVLFVGAALFVDILFAIRLPIVRIALAILLLAVGARMLLRGVWPERRSPDSGDVLLSDHRFAPTELTEDARFDVTFGRAVVDLTHLAEPDHDVTVKVDAIFGAAIVQIDPALAYDVVGSSAFGEVKLPDHTATAFGDVRYRSRADHPPRLHLALNAAFGACQLVEVPSSAVTAAT